MNLSQYTQNLLYQFCLSKKKHVLNLKRKKKIGHKQIVQKKIVELDPITLLSMIWKKVHRKYCPDCCRNTKIIYKPLEKRLFIQYQFESVLLVNWQSIESFARECSKLFLDKRLPSHTLVNTQQKSLSKACDIVKKTMKLNPCEHLENKSTQVGWVKFWKRMG